MQDNEHEKLRRREGEREMEKGEREREKGDS